MGQGSQKISRRFFPKLSNYIKRLKLIEPFAFIHRYLDDPAAPSS
jgi:hypothetical protein